MATQAPKSLNPTENPTVSVDEASAILGVARTTVYQAVRDGSVPAFRVAGRIRIPTAALRRLLQLDSAEL